MAFIDTTVIQVIQLWEYVGWKEHQSNIFKNIPTGLQDSHRKHAAQSVYNSVP